MQCKSLKSKKKLSFRILFDKDIIDVCEKKCFE